jgi:GMP synthase-like glutamine amidotransferase
MSRPRILVIQHYKGSPAGLIAEEAAAIGAELDVIDAEQGCDLPEAPGEHDGMLLLGGVMGALDDHLCRHFPPLMGLTRSFADAGKPVLGICLGAQLLARAYGGAVHYRRNGEFGFIAPRARAELAGDPLLAGLGPPPPLMQWHDDSFDLPPGAVPLLDGEPCRCQAFRMGRGVWAFQGHFEVTRENAEAWGQLRAAWRNEPDAPHRVAAHLAGGWDRTEAFGRAVARRWLALCATASMAGSSTNPAPAE